MRLDQQVKGTRLLAGDEVESRRILLTQFADAAKQLGYREVLLPSLEPQSVYTDKAGPEVLNQMYTFQDRKGRDICLRPEGTATVQLLAQKEYKRQKDVKLWYETRCWRYEQPQAGRYREFTQVGFEVLWPKAETYEALQAVAIFIFDSLLPGKFEVNSSVKRGLAYYVGDGFEITVPSLGAQKQVLGGGVYDEGFGFGIGLDRLTLALGMG